MDSRTPFSKSQCPVADSEKARIMRGMPAGLMRMMPYRELIGSLLWVANGTRLDISFAVGSLAKYTSNPGRVHWEALLRILGYLSQTLNHCIRYKRNASNENDVPVRGYARGSCPSFQTFSAMSMRVLRVMLTLGGALLVTYSRSVEDQYHGRVGCNPLWHYPV